MVTGRCVSCVRRPLPSVSCVTQYSFVRSFVQQLLQPNEMPDTVTRHDGAFGKHEFALPMRVAAARTTSVLDCGAAVLFAGAAWRWSRVLLPTHMRPYPGTKPELTRTSRATSRVRCVPEAQGGLSPGPHVPYVLGMLTKALVRTACCGTAGTNVTLPGGDAWLFVRDPQHLLPFVPDARSSVGKLALEAGLVASVLLLVRARVRARAKLGLG